MFSVKDIPELKELTQKRRAFVLNLPVTNWNYAEAARRAFKSKNATFRGDGLIKNVKVAAAIEAIRRKLEEKATAENTWTFEESRRRHLELLTICKGHIEEKRDPKDSVTELAEKLSDRRRWIETSLKTMQALNLMHGYLVERRIHEFKGVDVSKLTTEELVRLKRAESPASLGLSLRN